jgi:hypothetical protein
VASGQAIEIVRDDTKAGGFDPMREALVEEPTLPQPGDAECWQGRPLPAARVSVSRYDEDRIDLAVSTPCAAVLVTSELAYPGWRAKVDERPVALATVNGAFRGLIAPRGDHRVELRYAPSLPWIARGIALVSLIAVLAAARSGSLLSTAPRERS